MLKVGGTSIFLYQMIELGIFFPIIPKVCQNSGKMEVRFFCTVPSIYGHSSILLIRLGLDTLRWVS